MAKSRAVILVNPASIGDILEYRGNPKSIKRSAPNMRELALYEQKLTPFD
jgi:hypothetical protein